jgi:hypothetical protein
MQRLEILLVHLLDRDKTHGRPRHRFANGFGIGWIILVRLHIGLHKLGRNEFHGMAMRAEPACPIMRPATGFHPDDCRGQLGDIWHQRVPRQTFSQHDIPRVIHPHEVKNPLCKVNS